MRIFALLLLTLLSCAAQAACPKHAFTDPKQVLLPGDSVLIVTHASSFYDSRLTSKRGIDEAVSYAKNQRIPVVYLQDDTPQQFYFMEDCQPDYWVHSDGGELSFDVPAHVYIAGGHLELCMAETVSDVLVSWAKQKKKNLRLTYLMDAIYSNGKSIDANSPYYADFEKFMNVVTYRRPGGEHWPKLSLLETMGVIRSEDHELEYLKDVLPHYERTLPGYRVELKMNDSVVKVLQQAPGWNPPTIRFDFVDSAVDLAEAQNK
jgi:hypothetical protein